MNNNFKGVNNIIASFLLTSAAMILLFKLFQYAPFGGNSLACMDANIQYLDFFALLKDVLQGNNSILYSLTNTLGGTGFGIFSYYLSSPLNLLVVFFEKEELHSFFDLIVALKMAIASATIAYFLEKRFNLHSHILLCLSLAYAFSQYNIAQSSNIMWLDGVYMLPLILLGVYRCVHDNTIYFLSGSVALSIIFNWYSAGINCIFSVIWFFVEFSLVTNVFSVKLFIKKFLQFTYAMLAGVLLSAFLFLPAIALLREGAGSGFDWNLMNFKLTGNVFTLIRNFAIGSISRSGEVSLYCGSITLIGVICIYGKQTLEKKQKVILTALLFVTVLLFYWQPFIFTFSMFKKVGSYWFRYSYVGIFALIFVAANFYQGWSRSISFPQKSVFFLIAATSIFVIANLFFPNVGQKHLYCIITVVFISLFFTLLYNLSSRIDTNHREWSSIALVILTLVELSYNAKILMGRYHYNGVENFKTYVINTQNQINGIKDMDKGWYRISQTSARNKYPNGLTASYNESVAFNYPSISSYTSCPDNAQMQFLEHLGYRTEKNHKTKIVNTSILGTDSLLGVKYILSDYPVRGLEQIAQLKNDKSKNVFLNKFAFPLAFVINGNKKGSSSENSIEKLNPFEYQNKLFGILYGREVNIYKPVVFSKSVRGKDVEYTISVPRGNYSLYGNLPWKREMNAVIYAEGKKLTSYAMRLSPSVFYIPFNQKHSSVKIKIKAKEELAIKEEQFYVLDLNLLKIVSRAAFSHQVADLKIDKSYIGCTANGDDGNKLVLSIPYHKGWTITNNGKKVLPELFDSCLMLLPLEKGLNRIQMYYRIPYLTEGCVLTLIGLFCLLVYPKVKIYQN